MSYLIDARAQHARRLATPPRPEEPPLYVERERPICGATLRLIGEPCARRPGHRDSHRSVESLRSDAQRRRKWAP
jgi:hypothetical protein